MLGLGNWFEVGQTDPRVVALYKRHYTCKNINHGKRIDYLRYGITGPGETLVLLSVDSSACYGWIYQQSRDDGQIGVNCFFFRNEGHILSSELIIEADEMAFRQWPNQERHFTYVDPVKTQCRRGRKSQAGECFIRAGWNICGKSKKGLVILERYCQ